MFGGWDHYTVRMRMKMKDKWKFQKRVQCGTKRIMTDRFKDEGIIKEYNDTVTEALNDEGGNVDSSANAKEVSDTLKNLLLSVTEEVMAMKVVKGKNKGENACWLEVEKVVKEKKDAHKYKYVLEKIRCSWKRKHSST